MGKNDFQEITVLFLDSKKSAEKNDKLLKILNKNIYRINDNGFTMKLRIVNKDNMKTYKKNGLVRFPLLKFRGESFVGFEKLENFLGKIIESHGPDRSYETYMNPEDYLVEDYDDFLQKEVDWATQHCTTQKRRDGRKTIVKFDDENDDDEDDISGANRMDVLRRYNNERRRRQEADPNFGLDGSETSRIIEDDSDEEDDFRARRRNPQPRREYRENNIEPPASKHGKRGRIKGERVEDAFEEMRRKGDWNADDEMLMEKFSNSDSLLDDLLDDDD
jgi:hypothetical protein